MILISRAAGLPPSIYDALGRGAIYAVFWIRIGWIAHEFDRSLEVLLQNLLRLEALAAARADKILIIRSAMLLENVFSG